MVSEPKQGQACFIVLNLSRVFPLKIQGQFFCMSNQTLIASLITLQLFLPSAIVTNHEP